MDAVITGPWIHRLPDSNNSKALTPCRHVSSLQHIAHVHAAIRSALDAFAAGAAALTAADTERVCADGLAALVERLRFLRAVCTYHSASEDDVVFPAVRCARFAFFQCVLYTQRSPDLTRRPALLLCCGVLHGMLCCPFSCLACMRRAGMPCRAILQH